MEMTAHWKRLCELHARTKHYLLIAEELSEDGDVFLQPMKEHRDAYDHIIRAFAADYRNDLPTEESKTDYMNRNMNEAYSHEFRAFFDTADWLSFICRKYIRNTLRNQKVKELKAFKEYEEIKTLINSMPEKIADLRARDGKTDKKNDVPQNVDLRVFEYCEILDALIEAYSIVHNKLDKA